jgi:hypothetical protein
MQEMIVKLGTRNQLKVKETHELEIDAVYSKREVKEGSNTKYPNCRSQKRLRHNSLRWASRRETAVRMTEIVKNWQGVANLSRTML